MPMLISQPSTLAKVALPPPSSDDPASHTQPQDTNHLGSAHNTNDPRPSPSRPSLERPPKAHPQGNPHGRGPTGHEPTHPHLPNNNNNKCLESHNETVFPTTHLPTTRNMANSKAGTGLTTTHLCPRGAVGQTRKAVQGLAVVLLPVTVEVLKRVVAHRDLRPRGGGGR
jgi:hypothetical protein